MSERSGARTLFAVVPLHEKAAINIRHRWRDIVPTTFPDYEHWLFCANSGTGIFGDTVTQGETIFATSHPVVHTSDAKKVDICGRAPIHEIMRTADRHPFSFISFDSRRKYFVAARDPLGQANLFYRVTPSYLFFSSDLGALLSDLRRPNLLDYNSAIHYLLYGRPQLGHTLAQGVVKLPAGHSVTYFYGGNVFLQRYYSPLSQSSQKVLSDKEKINLLSSLDRSINNVSKDEKQAILLSGGLDSSFIASTLSCKNKEIDLQAYTIEFASPYKDNETQFASLVAQANKIELNVVHMGTEDANRHLPHVLKMPEPVSAWAGLTHLHLIEKLATDRYSSFLSGLGADEVFGGYSRFLSFYRKLRFIEAKWSGEQSQDYFDALLQNPRQATENLFPGVPEFFSLRDFRKATRSIYSNWSPYLDTAAFYKECREIKPQSHIFELLIAHECQHRIPDLLFTSMESLGVQLGVVGRYPFLDEDVVRVACGLGATERFWLKGGRWQNKRLLKELAASRLPAEILDRKIGSYTTPISLWLADPKFREIFRGLLMEADLWKTGLISKAWRQQVDTLLFGKAVSANPNNLQPALEQAWAMVTLASWYAQWVRPAASSDTR